MHKRSLEWLQVLDQDLISISWLYVFKLFPRDFLSQNLKNGINSEFSILVLCYFATSDTVDTLWTTLENFSNFLETSKQETVS